MELVDVWPLFGLRLTTPRLELRIVRDDDLGDLVEAARSGIHDPEVMPFAVPWTDAEPDVMRRGLAQHQWRQRSSVSPEGWSLNFAVLLGGRAIGIQDLSAHDFITRRAVETGSWLAAARHGHGFGTEMRAAVLAFAFDHLGAVVAESGAAMWNESSLGVSRKLGYRLNGTKVRVGRPGEAMHEQQVRMLAEWFVRPPWVLGVEGAAAARRELGLSPEE